MRVRHWKTGFARLGVLPAAALALVLHGACDGDGGGSGTTSTELTDEQESVATSGEFLASCDDGVATIESFVENPDLATLLGGLLGEDVPLIGDVLAAGDPNALPIPGGFVPDPENPGAFLPISAEDVEDMLAGAGLSDEPPVIGKAPVTCDDVPTDPEDLPEPTDAIALIPVFEEVDGEEEVVALVMAVVGDASRNDPPEVSEVELSEDLLNLLPAELAAVLGDLLSLLD